MSKDRIDTYVTEHMGDEREEDRGSMYVSSTNRPTILAFTDALGNLSRHPIGLIGTLEEKINIG